MFLTWFSLRIAVVLVVALAPQEKGLPKTVSGEIAVHTTLSIPVLSWELLGACWAKGALFWGGERPRRSEKLEQ